MSPLLARRLRASELHDSVAVAFCVPLLANTSAASLPRTPVCERTCSMRTVSPHLCSLRVQIKASGNRPLHSFCHLCSFHRASRIWPQRQRALRVVSESADSTVQICTLQDFCPRRGLRDRGSYIHTLSRFSLEISTWSMYLSSPLVYRVRECYYCRATFRKKMNPHRPSPG